MMFLVFLVAWLAAFGLGVHWERSRRPGDVDTHWQTVEKLWQP